MPPEWYTNLLEATRGESNTPEPRKLAVCNECDWEQPVLSFGDSGMVMWTHFMHTGHRDIVHR